MRNKIKDKLSNFIPEIRLPEFTREVEIPVYLIHNSNDAEDYFFMIDFEDFAERSSQGLFVRPKLKLWAGRDDFSRTQFARYFREVFAAEFDNMRNELTRKKTGKLGWLTWKDALSFAPNLIGGLVANLILMIASSTGKALIGSMSLPRWMKTKSAGAKLEKEIDGLRTSAERALSKIEIALHRELYDHAFKDGPAGPVSGIDRDAWPLPQHVRAHFTDGRNRSWW